jgi:hypothetical protein
MKALKYIIISILVIVFAFLSFALFQPTDYHVEREITIQAPANIIHQQIVSFKNFNNWSPWAKMDPNAVNVYTGIDGEIGSIHSWSGNDEVGVGEQELMSFTDDKITFELRFKEPFESVSLSYFNINEFEGKTKVIWGFDGNSSFPMNGLLVFMDMDGMLGNDFEKGLNSLKQLSEELHIANQKSEEEIVALEETQNEVSEE